MCLQLPSHPPHVDPVSQPNSNDDLNGWARRRDLSRSLGTRLHGLHAYWLRLCLLFLPLNVCRASLRSPNVQPVWDLLEPLAFHQHNDNASAHPSYSSFHGGILQRLYGVGGEGG